MNIEKLKKIIEELGTLELEIPDENIFEKAVDIYISEEIKQNIEERAERESKRSMMATDKQINVLKRAGITIPQNLTKQEATVLINNMFDQQKSGGQFF